MGCGRCHASPARTTTAGGRGTGEDSGVSVRPHGQGSAVRPVGAGSPKAPHTVRPLRFDQAQEVADTFKHGQPVIMNVQEVDRDLLRRLIDFASGLCYTLNGKLDKVATGCLPPDTVDRVGRGPPADGRAGLRIDPRPSAT